jgi:hypothetical protein
VGRMSPSDLFDDESPDLKEEIELIVADPDKWLHTPNLLFGGRSPIKLFDTPEGRQQLRDWIRAVKYGLMW